MKAHFLTLEQAIKIRDKYKDKVIGFPIDKIDHPHWLISDIQVVTVDGINWNVVVWSRGDDKIGVGEDWFGLKKYAIMKYLIVYLRETNQLSQEESDLWF